WYLTQVVELHRPFARARLPVPALGSVDAAPPQRPRRSKLDPVAGGPTDDRGRAGGFDVPRVDSRPALAQRGDVRPWQRASADRNPAFPARQSIVAARGVDGDHASPDVAARDALPGLVRLLHDHRRPDAAPDAAADRIDRTASTDPLGASRHHRLRGPAL